MWDEGESGISAELTSSREKTFRAGMDPLKEKLQEIGSLIPSGAPVAFFDYPVYGNIGDMLILAGVRKFFRDRNVQVTCWRSMRNFPGFRLRRWVDRPPLRLERHAVIVLNGGGNFGDLYPRYQIFREHVVRSFPENRIILLPQSIHFQRQEGLERAAAEFHIHPDLHIFARDKTSFATARRWFRNAVHLAPDMSHQLWPSLSPLSPEPAREDGLFLIRRDEERSTIPVAFLPFQEQFTDWHHLLSLSDQSFILSHKLLHELAGLLRLGGAEDGKWFSYTEALIQRAVAWFASRRFIVTSRLHGHILACLLMKPNVLLDNSYGKNSSYFRTWTHRLQPYCECLPRE